MAVAKPAKELKKYVKGTNIVVEKLESYGIDDACLGMLNSIANDDLTEIQWFKSTLRPQRNLVHPSEAFIQSIKALRPAAIFNTFDIKKAKLRRLAKQNKDKKKALDRRKKEIVPTAAFKASVNPHKIPRTGGHATEDEIRFLSRGKKKKSESTKGYFTKWKKEKAQKIGKKI